MRKELFYNPRILLERLAEESVSRRRLKKIKGTYAEKFVDVNQIGHLDFLLYIKSVITPKNIYDIGANEGIWSILAQTIFPNSAIHAFEPIERYQNAFLKNVKPLQNIYLHKTGIGNENGKFKMNFAGHASSFFEIGELITEINGIKKEGEMDVELSKLDDFVQTNNIKPPDIIKIDAEGYELEVLKGGVNSLKFCKFLIVEVSFEERHIGQPIFADIVNFLSSYNFHLEALPCYTPLTKKLIMLDILFKNRNIKTHL